MTWQLLGRTGIVVGVIAGLVLAPQPMAMAQPRMYLSTCKQLIPRPDALGSVLWTRECGRRFTTQDPYVGLVVNLENVVDQWRVEVVLLDPEQNSVWAYRTTVAPSQPGYVYTWWVWAVLPVAADAAALARENSRLAGGALTVRGKPVRERLGEWTLRVALDGGYPTVLKFTLEAAP